MKNKLKLGARYASLLENLDLVANSNGKPFKLRLTTIYVGFSINTCQWKFIHKISNDLYKQNNIILQNNVSTTQFVYFSPQIKFCGWT